MANSDGAKRYVASILGVKSSALKTNEDWMILSFTALPADDPDAVTTLGSGCCPLDNPDDGAETGTPAELADNTEAEAAEADIPGEWTSEDPVARTAAAVENSLLPNASGGPSPAGIKGKASRGPSEADGVGDDTATAATSATTGVSCGKVEATTVDG